MVINEKGVVKNVDAAPVQGTRAAATPTPVFTRALMALALASLGTLALARSAAGLGADVSLASLPPEARRTEQLIHAGGPFPYAKDGAVFGNYEKRLAPERRGYYHEYTVPTPGARNRGARRIICGGRMPTEPEACFYTEDHYGSFHRILK